MNYSEVLKQLYVQRDKVDEAIRVFEGLQRELKVDIPREPKKRGRKFMAEAERQEVSARMKRYWARRRREKGASA